MRVADLKQTLFGRMFWRVPGHFEERGFRQALGVGAYREFFRLGEYQCGLDVAYETPKRAQVEWRVQARLVVRAPGDQKVLRERVTIEQY